MTSVSQSQQMALDQLEAALIDWDTTIPRFIGAFYGEPGAGKTVLSMALAQAITPPDQNILMMDTSDGWISVKNHRELMARAKPSKYLGLSNLQQIAYAIRARKDNFFGRTGTIILDELSTITRNTTLGVARAREAAAGISTLDMGSSDFRDYLSSQNGVWSVFELLQSIPDLNIICTSHAKLDDDSKKFRMNMSAGILSDLVKAFQVIGFATCDVKMNKETKEPYYDRRIQVHQTTMVSAKSRIGGFATTTITHPELVKGIRDFLKIPTDLPVLIPTNGITVED